MISAAVALIDVIPLNVAFDGLSTMENANGSPSASEAVKVMAREAFTAVETVWLLATGGMFGTLTITSTVAMLLSFIPSLALKVKLSVPLKFVFGV